MNARRPFRRKGEETRRAALIEAALACIAEGGPQAATVRAIALRAGVTQGLIRHYFATKEDLIAAAHDHLMTGLTEASAASLGALPADPRARLEGFVANAVSPPVVDPRAMALWAASMQLVARDPAMREVHERTYRAFRDQLEALIADALQTTGRPADPATTRRLAIAGNALLDGLWLEASALPEQLPPEEARAIAIDAFESLLGLELKE
ncbi:TetR/AcrR family transcriptional regulator [Roseovarius autotrophicus]|uniref:TetR/AcrR family transcriptional regulator n=1 Tax=Roseovarius autotrophicus TaxID=2824121 RepID=UPI001A06A711|nr:TetR family transcriptional regulator C-terminal domain-containing protein [Roseovarius autotrophicus]MBE0453142.1 TetR family transcriptional regulator C-terminal domain-containing protein [Roseovarius sp.]